MHFHNVYYWGKSRYHLEFSPNRTNYGRQVPLKQTLGGLSIVVRIPTRMSAVLHRKEFMFKTFVTFGFLPLCHLIRSKNRGGLLLYYVNTSGYPWPSDTVKSFGFFKLYLFSLNREHASPRQDDSGNVRILQRGLFFLFVHWFNEGCCVEGGETGEEVCSIGKVTKKTKGTPSFSVNWEFFLFP